MDKRINFNSKTIKVFLLSRGWELSKEDDVSFSLIPPKYIEFSVSNFEWRVPKIQTSTYYRQMRDIIKDISNMYELPEKDLIDLFSKPYEQVKKEALLLKDMALFI